MKDIIAHDATQDITSQVFTAPKCSKLIVSIKHTGIVDGDGTLFLNQSNIDPVGADPVPAIPAGVEIKNGTDTITFEVTSPADKFEFTYNHDAISAGTLDVIIKILYSTDSK